jgi:hypothetical protein
MPVTVKEAPDNKIEVIGEHEGKEIVILDSDKDGWNVGSVRAFPHSIEQTEAYLRSTTRRSIECEKSGYP